MSAEKLDMTLDEVSSSSSNQNGNNSRKGGNRNNQGGKVRNNRNNNNRSAPYQNGNRNNNNNNQGMQLDSSLFMQGMVPMQNIDLSQQVLKVSSQSNPKGSAGSISHTIRRGQNPQVICSGSTSINQAIKAIAIARGYLEQDAVDVSVTGTWRDREMQKITLSVTKTARAKKHEEPDLSGDLRIAQNSQPGTVAGAIAKKVRAGERVGMIAIGANSVANACMSIIIARRYLQDDGVDISFRPEFVHLQMNDEQRSAVRFNVLRHDV